MSRSHGTRVAMVVLVGLLVSLGLQPPLAAAGPRPSTPRSVKAVAAAPGSVKVSWRAPRSAGTEKIDRYKVVRWAQGVPRKALKVGPSKRSLTLSRLVAGKRYSFSVQAHNAHGWGDRSKTVTAVPTPSTPPPPPPPPGPLDGFGTLSAPCLRVAEELDDTAPSLYKSSFDFGDDPYDNPADLAQLTSGGQQIMTTPGAGGSSQSSEVFAFEALARCEGASLLKTDTEIIYDVEGKKADLLVEIAGAKVGVSVTRAVTFPFGDPYTLSAATTLMNAKLDDVVASSQNVSTGDAWVKQILVVFAIDEQHAETVEAAWLGLDAETKADTVVYVVTSAGSDMFLYSDS